MDKKLLTGREIWDLPEGTPILVRWPYTEEFLEYKLSINEWGYLTFDKSGPNEWAISVYGDCKWQTAVTLK